MELRADYHDLPNGSLSRCQICNSRELKVILDLGHHAPCDSLLNKKQLREQEASYPLRFVTCTECGLAQIDYVVPPEVLFYPEYPYRSGITETLKKNLHSLALTTTKKIGLKENDLVIDIGSNDGTILEGYKAAGMRVLGVEPTNIAQIAIENGIETVNEFFNADVAERIKQKYGQSPLITAANMFAHVPNLGSLIQGVNTLLVDGGVFITESHYLMDIVETVQYDSIYHEHLKFYSLKPLSLMMQQYGFTLTDAERIPNYGGSIRVYATKGKKLPQSERLLEMIAREKDYGLYEHSTYEIFRDKVLKSKLDLQTLLMDIKNSGKTVAGVGCPGRSSTLLNYCRIDTDVMPYIAEQSTSLKLGLFLPGTHIPIVDEEILFREQPDYVVMLSWHYSEPIIKSLRKKGLKSKIILPLPEVRVLED